MSGDTQDSVLHFPEQWSVTPRLRFVLRWENHYGMNSEMRILQQLHVSNRGNQQWRDVPLEAEIT